MQPIEIIVIALSVVFVSAVVIAGIIRKKKGKSSCCSDCSHCKYNCSQKVK